MLSNLNTGGISKIIMQKLIRMIAYKIRVICLKCPSMNKKHTRSELFFNFYSQNPSRIYKLCKPIYVKEIPQKYTPTYRSIKDNQKFLSHNKPNI